MNQVLIEWIGVGEGNKSWEEVGVIAGLIENLEDKISAEESGNVTIDLDLKAVAARLKDELSLE